MNPRRGWLFVPGADAVAHAAAARSAADVLIQELEDFTPPELRPVARRLAATLYDRWRAAGKVAAVRVNPLEGDGVAELGAVLAGWSARRWRAGWSRCRSTGRQGGCWSARGADSGWQPCAAGAVAMVREVSFVAVVKGREAGGPVECGIALEHFLKMGGG